MAKLRNNWDEVRKFISTVVSLIKPIEGFQTGNEIN